MSLSKQILNHLEKCHPYFVHSAELEKLAGQWGYKASNCGRRCRELFNKGLIERRYGKQNCVLYQFKKPFAGKPTLTHWQTLEPWQKNYSSGTTQSKLFNLRQF